MTILLTGGSGQVGTALRSRAWPDGIALVAPPRQALDLGDPAALAAAVAARPWRAIINAGAYTAVDRAEGELAAAWTINALAPAVLAQAAARAGIPLIQLSTDYVFDGRKPAPYIEADGLAPLGVYGASKAGGELAVRSAGGRHVILRTSWVVSAHGHNFIKTMLRLGRERPRLHVVDDQIGAPTGAADIAAAVAAVTLRLLADPGAPTGLFHLTNDGATSWCGLAREVFRLAAARGGPAPEVAAIGTAAYPTAARRPANSRLCLERIRRDYGLAPRPWEAAVADIVAALLPAADAAPPLRP